MLTLSMELNQTTTLINQQPQFVQNLEKSLQADFLDEEWIHQFVSSKFSEESLKSFQDFHMELDIKYLMRALKGIQAFEYEVLEDGTEEEKDLYSRAIKALELAKEIF